jgi:tripartite ATP-independent transporter DctM subunit
VNELTALALLVVFGALLLLGVPIAFTLGLTTVLLLAFSLDPAAGMTVTAHSITTGMDSFTLLAIPFFILAGQFMNSGGVARRLIEFAKVVVGIFPGGLALVNIVACVLFGAISGSAVAAVAAIGGFLNPLMVKEGYERGFNAAVNITSGTTGLIIPPSNVLIIYALASGSASIKDLFLAGYVPGLLIAFGLAIVAGFTAHRRGYPRPEGVKLSEALRRFFDALPSLLLIIIVMGGIVMGIFTATEASAIAVVYTAILAIVVYREVKIRDIPRVILKACLTTGIVLFLVASSLALSWLLSFEFIPQTISAGLLAISDNPIITLLIINFILLAVGTFMDMTPAVLIFTPIFLPVAMEMGVDPVQFGIIMVMNLCIGLCTPPVGSALFIGCGVAGIGIPQVMRPILPFFAVMIAVLLLVTFVPALSLALPAFFK